MGFNNKVLVLTVACFTFSTQLLEANTVDSSLNFGEAGCLPFFTNQDEAERKLTDLKIADLIKVYMDFPDTSVHIPKEWDKDISLFELHNYRLVNKLGVSLLKFPLDVNFMSCGILGQRTGEMTLQISFPSTNCSLNYSVLKDALITLLHNITMETMQTTELKNTCYFSTERKEKYPKWRYFMFVPYYSWNTFKTFCKSMFDETEIESHWSTYITFVVSITVVSFLPLCRFILPWKARDKFNELGYKRHSVPFSLKRLLAYIMFCRKCPMKCCSCMKRCNIFPKTDEDSGHFSKKRLKCRNFCCWHIAPIVRICFLLVLFIQLFNVLVHEIKLNVNPNETMFINEILLGPKLIVFAIQFGVSFFSIIFIYRSSFTTSKFWTRNKYEFLQISTKNGGTGCCKTELQQDDCHEKDPLTNASGNYGSLHVTGAELTSESTSTSSDDSNCMGGIFEKKKLTEILEKCSTDCNSCCSKGCFFVSTINVLLILLQCIPVIQLLCCALYIDCQNVSLNWDCLNCTACSKNKQCTCTRFPICIRISKFLEVFFLTLVILFAHYVLMNPLGFLIQMILYTLPIGLPFYPSFAVGFVAMFLTYFTFLIKWWKSFQQEYEVILEKVFEHQKQYYDDNKSKNTAVVVWTEKRVEADIVDRYVFNEICHEVHPYTLRMFLILVKACLLALLYAIAFEAFNLGEYSKQYDRLEKLFGFLSVSLFPFLVTVLFQLNQKEFENVVEGKLNEKFESIFENTVKEKIENETELLDV